MSIEEQILHKIKQTGYETEEVDELNHYIHTAFQQSPNSVSNLFWKLFHEYHEHPKQYNWKEPLYFERIFWGIISQPTIESIKLTNQIMAEPYNHLQEHAAVFLGEAKSPLSVPYLINALKSDDYNIVSRSAIALGEIGDTRAMAPLLKIVEDYNADWVYDDDRIDDAYPIIRSNAFTALCMLNTPEAQQKILESLDDRDLGIQGQAIWYLSTKMPEVARQYLKDLSKHHNDYIASRAKECLQQLDINEENQ